jgi:hypothetical protein
MGIPRHTTDFKDFACESNGSTNEIWKTGRVDASRDMFRHIISTSKGWKDASVAVYLCIRTRKTPPNVQTFDHNVDGEHNPCELNAEGLVIVVEGTHGLAIDLRYVLIISPFYANRHSSRLTGSAHAI